ncbi:hypothetical protein [Leptotrichia sp. oral taxon 223]|uniref:hypothetical protein n=1 Tax=Leptotrichia sp. oral taxon 223 TaxID=712363 RepID=UPI0015C0D416|nr:hypothetical protein [Leptotrichia sp. oral taxon 223]NWO18856.1 hypothetical protein [Leptotrichia sp. oral taxon 223]
MRKVVSAIITILYVTIILGSLGLLVYKTINDISNVKTLLEFAKLMLIDFILYVFWGVGVQILTFVFGLFKIKED